MGKTVNEIEQLERTLDKESITFKELKEGILKYKAKSEYQQAAIIIIRGVLEKRLHANGGLHKHLVSGSASFDEVKRIWNAAENYIMHELGEICKGDSSYCEDVPDLETYFDKHYR